MKIKPYYPANEPHDGFLDDDQKKNPGWYVNVNWDDDDEDGWNPDDHSPGATYTPDKDDTLVAGGDDDLWKFTVEIVPESIHGDIRLTFNESKVKVYGQRTKENPFANEGTVTFEGQPITLYLEGRAGTEAFRDVELRGVYAEPTPNVEDDYVKITVFEVTLEPVFEGPQASEEECPPPVRHRILGGSDDRNGKISLDDANGDGTIRGEGDEDEKCVCFRNCMEDRGAVRPRDITNQVEFDFKRETRGKEWRVPTGAGNWYLVKDSSDSWHDDEQPEAEDNTPSQTDYIYQIDGPGYALSTNVKDDYYIMAYNFRDWVMVKLYGTWHQCSTFQKWHHHLYIQPRSDDPTLLRRAGATPAGPTPEWTLQKLDGDWVAIPPDPE